jgi:ribonuclease J
VSSLEIIPLGGVGEFGMNCMAVRFEDEVIIIDTGMGFPEESVFGVDVAIPDFDFLEEYRDLITAVIITHAHEDHVGALPYFLKKFNVPVYASRFTLGLAESKLEEHGILEDVVLHRVEPRDIIDLGKFKIEFIRVSHSLVDCFSLAIITPAGTIIHTGDYKVDETPIIGEPIDLRVLRQYGQAGVLALLSDSTNASVPGRTPSERAVIPAFEELFAESQGRIIVTTFASSIHRIQIILDVAQQFNRKVCLLGRTMLRNYEIADKLGYLDVPDGLIIGQQETKYFSDDELVLLVTGTQGETRSVLSQMATGSYKGFAIEPGDTVVLSARIIPGNDRAISRLIGDIYKRGGNIIDEKRRLVHVSGHASREDIRILTDAVRPKFVIPIHGEYRLLYRHKEFIKNHLGYKEENIVLIENGDVLVLDQARAVIVEKKGLKKTYIDESGFEEIQNDIVKERRQLASEGIITPVVTINSSSGNLEAPPKIVCRGVIGASDSNGLCSTLQRIVEEAVESASRAERLDTDTLKERVRLEVKRYVQKQTGSKPVITPIVVEI